MRNLVFARPKAQLPQHKKYGHLSAPCLEVVSCEFYDLQKKKFAAQSLVTFESCGLPVSFHSKHFCVTPKP
jgi:hypothetical protein